MPQEYKNWLYSMDHSELVAYATDVGLDAEDYATDEDLCEAIAEVLEKQG